HAGSRLLPGHRLRRRCGGARRGNAAALVTQEGVNFRVRDIDSGIYLSLAQQVEPHFLAQAFEITLPRHTGLFEFLTQLIDSETVALGDRLHGALNSDVAHAYAPTVRFLTLQLCHDHALQHLSLEDAALGDGDA